MSLVCLQQPIFLSANGELTRPANRGWPTLRQIPALEAARCARLEHRSRRKPSIGYAYRIWNPYSCMCLNRLRGNATANLVDKRTQEDCDQDLRQERQDDSKLEGIRFSKSDHTDIDIIGHHETRERHKYLMIIAYDGTDYAGEWRRHMSGHNQVNTSTAVRVAMNAASGRITCTVHCCSNTGFRTFCHGNMLLQDAMTCPALPTLLLLTPSLVPTLSCLLCLFCFMP